jgi:hypothetical protein
VGSGSGAPDDHGRPTRRDPVDRLVAERVGQRVLGAWDVGRGPAIEGAQRPPGVLPERDQLRILDPPAASQLLDDQLRIEQHDDLPRPELAGQGQGTYDRRVLRNVVRLDAEELRDRGVGSGPRVARVGPGKVDQGGTGRSEARIAAGRSISPDDEAATGPTGSLAAGSVDGRRPERRLGSARIGGQSGSPGGEATGSADLPVSLRQTIWIGS